MTTVDLNADLGEGFPFDAELLEIVTSASVACGGHTGDAISMRATLRLARARNVAVGAHPSFPDREHFGRRALTRTPAQVYSDVTSQVRALAEIAHDEGMALSHVKAHGALYNISARDANLADAIAHAVHDVDARLSIYALAGSAMVLSARSLGVRVVEEIFADRRYLPDGSLVPRTSPNALIETQAESVSQTLEMIGRGIGSTICVHGDTPGAVEFARAIRAGLRDGGVQIASR